MLLRAGRKTSEPQVTGRGRGGAAGRRAALAAAELTWARSAHRAVPGLPGLGPAGPAALLLAVPPVASKKYHQPGACRRCARIWLVNADSLCPPCITEIQQSDAAWYFSPAPAPRPVQLVFILPGLRLPHRTPFGSYRAFSDGRFHPPWARAQIPAEVLNDPRFCPPALAGQLPLLETRPTLTVADARNIRNRVLAGWDQAEPALAAYAAEHEYGQAWQQTMSAVLRPLKHAQSRPGAPAIRSRPAGPGCRQRGQTSEPGGLPSVSASGAFTVGHR